MYKKITHTIVEEHFGHPIGAEIKSYLEKDHKAEAINLSQAIKFRLNARNYFSRLQMKIRNYVYDLLDTTTDATTKALVLDNLNKIIDECGDTIVPYYGAAAGIALSGHLKEYVTALGEHIKLIKEGKDTKDTTARVTKAIDDLAKFLSTANPKSWPADAVIGIFTSYRDAVIAQADALIKKDIKAEDAAETLQHDILLGNMRGSIGFADTFVNGIIKQFPELFSY